ncbi:MAG: hypothetical protein ABI433_07435 [Burkholderiaceae bacterium]
MGEYSLARSYWLHTLLLSWGLGAAFAYVLNSIGETYPVRYVSMAVIAYLPMALLVWAWSTFGTAISALKHLFGDSGRFWAVAALLSLGIGSIAVLKEVLTLKPSCKRIGPSLRANSRARRLRSS